MKSLRSWVALPLLSVLACASTGSIGPTEYFAVDYDLVWAAALDAAHALGARIRVENRATGVIAATIVTDSAGTSIAIDISVSKSLAGADVQVSARTPGATDDDHIRTQENRDLERRYLELVAAGIREMERRYGGSARRPYSRLEDGRKPTGVSRIEWNFNTLCTLVTFFTK